MTTYLGETTPRASVIRKRISFSVVVTGLLLAAAVAVPARAEVITWGGGTGVFGTAANWVGGAAPGESDIATFSGWSPLPTTGWTATASNTDGANPLANALDGRRSTRWASGAYQAPGLWFKIDMASPQTFSRVDLDAGSAFAADDPVGYSLAVSSDDSSYTTIATGAGTDGLTAITFTAQTARYIRVTLTASSGTNWWGIAEYTVYGTAGATQLSRNGWTASASNSEGASPPSNALDSSLITDWATGALQANGHWFKVDMGTTQTFTGISMDAYTTTGDYPRTFTLAVSTNDSSYTTVASGVTLVKEFILYTFASQAARYIRITQTGSSGTNWWSIHNFNVYGSPANASIGTSATIGALALNRSITVTQSPGVALTVAGAYSQSAGSFAGGNSLISVGGDFTLSGGTFTSTSDLLQVDGAFNNSGATFTHNSGRLMLTSGGGKTFATNSQTFNNVYVNDGLIAYWPFEETASPSLDMSGWGRTATWFNSTNDNTAHGTTRFTNARSLGFASATSDYATFSSPAMTAATVAAWVYATNRPSAFPRIMNTPTFQFSFSDNSQISPQVNNAVCWTVITSGTQYEWRSPAGSITDGAWYHVAATFNGTSTAAIYINGVGQMLTQPTTGSGSPISNVGTGYIGNRAGLDRDWNGYIDDLRIYDRVLSAAEIADIYSGVQRTTPVGTQTLSGTLTTAGDLVLASGTLDVSSTACTSAPCGVTVGGDWLNLGGAFTPRTGTVTFNGSGGVIQSDQVPFYNVTFSDTDTWTLQDRLYVGSTLTMSAAGTLAQSGSNYPIHAGTLVKTTGSITGSGAVVLDSGGDQSLRIDSLTPPLRIESPEDNGLAGYWKLDDGRGTTAADLSGNGHNGTIYNNAIWSTSVPTSPAIPIDDAGSLSFTNSKNQYVRVTRTATLEPTAVTMSAWVKRVGNQSQYAKVAIKTYNNTGSAPYQSYAMQMNNNGSSHGQVHWELGFVGGTTSGISSASNALGDGTWAHVVGVYDPAGSAPQQRLYVNGVLVDSATKTDALAYDTSSASDFYVGQSGGSNNYFNGNIDDVRVYNRGLSANEVAALYSYGYTTGSSAVYSLSADSAVGSTLTIDSGILDAVSFSNSITGAATINGGTYKIGSDTAGQTFTGGMAVNRYGELTLASNGGKAIMGAGSTLAMDGTLTASSTGAAIQSASSTYNFRVGTVSGATPTLNITGLQVKNTSANGMYINYDTGATTTFTRFDNIAFTDGAGTGTGNYNLRIYATSLYLTSNGCSFDAGVAKTVEKNVHVVGNGVGDGETRVVLGGATCASSQTCEGYDSDDDNDATPNGVGDNAGNASVIQWVHAAHADTSGSIEGFPTAAFDWNNFSYYSTYVAYHDTDGGTADTVYVRNAAGTAQYSWSTASGEEIVGTPRWDTVSNVHYVYVAVTGSAGTGAKVYRLIDNGSTLTADTGSPWNGGNNPYSCNCTITTPLAQDTNNLYWGGWVVGPTHKLWALVKTTRTLVGAALNTTYTTYNTAPAIWGTSPTYAFLGLAGHIVKFNVTSLGMSDDNTNPSSSTPVTGRITIIFNKLYAGDDNGWFWSLDPSSMVGTAKFWGYRNHASAIKSHYFDPAYSRAYFGDQDGHIMVVGSTGTAVTGFPWSTGSGAFATAPFYSAGVIIAGTTTGTLYFIDQNSNGSVPAKIQIYEFGSSNAISGIGYDPVTGRYMAATANAAAKDGKLYYFAAASDPTPAFP